MVDQFIVHSKIPMLVADVGAAPTPSVYETDDLSTLSYLQYFLQVDLPH